MSVQRKEIPLTVLPQLTVHLGLLRKLLLTMLLLMTVG